MQEKMAVDVEPVEPVEHGSSSALVITPARTETLVQYEPQEVTKQEVAADKIVSYGEEATAKASEEQKDSFELPPRLVLDSTPSSPTTSASVSNTSSATCCSSQEEEVPECADSKMHTDCKSALKRAKAQPWTEEEHLRFLTGLQKLGKGNWSSVSKYFVPTRTPAQVASHAQKHFMRLSTYYQCQGGIRKRKSRFSVLDSACAAAGGTNQRVLKPANGQVYQPAYGWSAACQPKKLLPTTAGWPVQSHFAHQVNPSGTTHYTHILPAIAPRPPPRLQAPPQPLAVAVPTMIAVRVTAMSLIRPMPFHAPVLTAVSSTPAARLKPLTHNLQRSLHSAFQVLCR